MDESLIGHRQGQLSHTQFTICAGIRLAKAVRQGQRAGSEGPREVLEIEPINCDGVAGQEIRHDFEIDGIRGDRLYNQFARGSPPHIDRFFARPRPGETGG